PIADLPRLDYKAPTPESVAVAAVRPITFSIGPIPWSEIDIFPTSPSSETLLGSEERKGLLTNVDSPPVAASLANGEYKIANVSIQIREDQQRARAIRIAQRLCTAGYTVAEIELVAKVKSYPSAGGIRYYYDEQSGEAEQIAALIADASAPLKA